MNKTNKKRVTIPSQISGMAGVHYVAYELSRRGFVVLLTNRNLAGFDLVATSQDGLKRAIIQVKSLQKKGNHWPLGKDVPKYMRISREAFYTFVRFNDKVEKFECFVATAKEVDRRLKKHIGVWLKNRKAKSRFWAYSWFYPQNGESQYRDRWDKLNLD